MNLRWYQEDMLDQAETAFRMGARSVLAVAPTGAGKTIMFSAMAQRQRGRVGIVAHRRELIRQASGKLTVAHGIIAPGFPDRADERVQVGSVQTMVRRLDKLPRFKRLVFDEAHHSLAATWRNLRAAQAQAQVFGVTATPELLSGRGLGEAYDVMIVGPSIADLTPEYLSPVVVYAPPAPPDMCGVRTMAGDWSDEELAAIMDQPRVTGDAMEHYFWHTPGQPAIVFCTSIAHAEHTAAAFSAEGWRAVAVHGKSPNRDRDIAGLGTGDVELLCVCDLISEGVDIPNVSVVIHLRPSQSLGLVMQMNGRGMRLAPRKKRLTILDHAGNTLRHGMPDAERAWTLEGTPKRDRIAPPVRQCSSCFAIFAPAPACPQCGAVDTAAKRSAKQDAPEDGTLVQLQADDPRLLRLRSAPLRDLIKEAKGYSALLEIETARNFKPGWAQITLERKATLHRQYRNAA